MKKLVFLLFMMSEFLLSAQIPKNANMIIITGDESQQAYLKQINDLLFENGYGIFSSDPAQGTITTTEKSYKRGNIKFMFLVKEKKISIRGQYNTGVNSPSEWYDVANKGMKGSPALEAWNVMTKIADAVPGEKEYLVK